LLAALNYRGLPRRFLELAEERVFRLQVSEPILNETMRIVQERFQRPLAQAQAARELLSAMAQCVTDPDDNRILECAQASQSDYLVPSDKGLTATQTICRDTHSEARRVSRAHATDTPQVLRSCRLMEPHIAAISAQSGLCLMILYAQTRTRTTMPSGPGACYCVLMTRFIQGGLTARRSE
jgi:predicted nucleic acid-binding protein